MNVILLCHTRHEEASHILIIIHGLGIDLFLTNNQFLDGIHRQTPENVCYNWWSSSKDHTNEIFICKPIIV